MEKIATQMIGIIADDFTGALDAGAQFARAGLSSTLGVQPAFESGATVQIVNTDSREADAETARQRVGAAARQLAGRRIFKKIDSTMRGHVGVEIEQVLAATGLEKAIVCPAIVEAGRLVENGQLLVGGTPLHQGDFARDPAWPARTSDIGELVGRPATHIGLEVVRAGSAAIARAIAAAPTQIVTLDACADADLIAIGQAAAARPWLPCGALALARAWAAALVGRPGTPTEMPVPAHAGPILIVAGSRHPSTTAQVDQLVAQHGRVWIEVSAEAGAQFGAQVAEIAIALAAGHPALIRAQRSLLGAAQQRRALAENLAALARAACQAQRIGALVLAGGETASAVCHALGVAGIQLHGEIAPGMPWGRIEGGFAAGALVVTKAGGFGHAGALVEAIERLRRQQMELD